jgi:hypothetical protein
MDNESRFVEKRKQESQAWHESRTKRHVNFGNSAVFADSRPAVFSELQRQGMFIVLKEIRTDTEQ